MQGRPQFAEPTYRAPFGGWHSQLPAHIIPSSHSPFHENVLFRNGEILAAPNFKYALSNPIDRLPVRAINSFVDNNTVAHTVAITGGTLYQLINNPIYKDPQPAGNRSIDNPWFWVAVDNFDPAGQNTPIASRIFLNKVYYTGGTHFVYSWNGIDTTVVKENELQGGFFLGELGFHLIILNTVELEGTDVVSYPQRVRWTPSGLPDVWNPASNPGAGFNDMLDVPDSISGFITLGRVGYIFRANGITQMSLTGRGSIPFKFDHLWSSDKGIGNIYPFGIASYGATGIFISSEDIYKITPGSFENIAGGARDKIFEDLADAAFTPIGTITPAITKKFIYPCYMLFIPRKNFSTIMWTYNIEDKNWSRRVIDRGIVTAQPRTVMVK
jgi:hypothetical protein